MRKMITVAAVALLLAGCTSTTGGQMPGSEVSETGTTQSPTPSAEASSTPSPTPEPSDVRTSDDGENITYTLAGGDLELTLPNTWSDVVESSRSFPIAVRNPEGSQRVVVAEIGPARLTPETEQYRDLLVEQLNVDDGDVAYLGSRYAGDGAYPAFEVVTDEYAAWIFLVTADERQFELTVKADTYGQLSEALEFVKSLRNTTGLEKQS
ncbi:hypothetical protein [Trueperella bialowiezensis]|nr:hypothetical protein [Trueperella bialowiezensis]